MILIYGDPEDSMVVKLTNICHRRSVPYKVMLSSDPRNARLLYEKGLRNLPQVFDDLDYLGDCSDLVNYIEVVTKIEEL